MVPEGFGRLYPYRVGNLIDRGLSLFEMTLCRQQTLMGEPPIRRRPCLCEKVSSEAAGRHSRLARQQLHGQRTMKIPLRPLEQRGKPACIDRRQRCRHEL